MSPFLSSPIACVSCEQMELLKTPIHEEFFFSFFSLFFCVCKKHFFVEKTVLIQAALGAVYLDTNSLLVADVKWSIFTLIDAIFNRLFQFNFNNLFQFKWNIFFKHTFDGNTVVCKIVHKFEFASVWCKIALGGVGVSLPWWCAALVLLAPGYWSLF